MKKDQRRCLLVLFLGFVSCLLALLVWKQGTQKPHETSQERPASQQATSRAVAKISKAPSVTAGVSALKEAPPGASLLSQATSKKSEDGSTFPEQVIRMLTADDIIKYEEVFAAAAPVSKDGQSVPQLESCLLAFAERTGIDPWAYDMKTTYGTSFSPLRPMEKNQALKMRLCSQETRGRASTTKR